ncbi:hypothetical protein FOA52_002208 [Chlamydomonas sp. UWO 241]|nr:hypothetical protein FOA52_002208 [Chlamydomonas sp. UWO 241]
MARTSPLLVALLALLALLAASGTRAQISSGILYWCAMEETGANIPAGTNLIGPNASPRSIYGVFSGAPSRESTPCHVSGSGSNCQKMTFSNGTLLPSNGAGGTGCPPAYFTPYDVDPTGCLTADNWGVDPSQCVYPGFGRDPLFITNGGMVAPTNYPITYDAKTTCNLAIMEQDVRAPSGPLAGPVAKLFAFKDYSDNLYVTVSMNATGFLPGQTGASNGQYLLPNPALPGDLYPTGYVFVGSTFPNGLPIAQYAQYTTSQTLSSSVGQYSCFTIMIPLRQACPYATSTFVRGVGGQPSYCASRATGAAVATVDLSSTPNLFFNAQFNVSNLYTVIFLNQSSRAYDQNVDCNYLWGADPLTGAKTFQLLGLYNAGAYSFQCQTQTVTTSTGAIQWSALYMKVLFLDPTLNLLFFSNLKADQGNFWSKIGSVSYPARRVFTAATYPFSLSPTGLPPPLNNDAAKFTNLFNQLYSQGVAREFSASPLFNFVQPQSGANTTDYLLLAGTITGPPQWPIFLANYADSSRMFILAGQFGLTCSDLVWANISGCPGIADANVAFTGFPSPPGIPTGTGFPNATQLVATPTPAPATAPTRAILYPSSTSYMMWMSTPSAAPNANVAVESVAERLCPAMNATISLVLSAYGLDYKQVMRAMQINGCAVVTPLPAAAGLTRVAYKFYFSLYAQEWELVAAALDSEGAMRNGHVMCDSTVYWQTYSSPAANTRAPINAGTRPEWLAQAASSTVCYADVFAPLH